MLQKIRLKYSEIITTELNFLSGCLLIAQKENTKLEILLVGFAIVVVFIHSLSKLAPKNLMLIAKQYLISVLSISGSTESSP